jgi:hypothetical protein
MRTLCLLVVGVVLGWAAGGVDWSRDADAQGVFRDTTGGEVADAQTARIVAVPSVEEEAIIPPVIGTPGLPTVPTDPLKPEASVPKTDKTLVADPWPSQSPAGLPAVNRYMLDAFRTGSGNAYLHSRLGDWSPLVRSQRSAAAVSHG